MNVYNVNHTKIIKTKDSLERNPKPTITVTVTRTDHNKKFDIIKICNLEKIVTMRLYTLLYQNVYTENSLDSAQCFSNLKYPKVFKDVVM